MIEYDLRDRTLFRAKRDHHFHVYSKVASSKYHHRRTENQRIVPRSIGGNPKHQAHSHEPRFDLGIVNNTAVTLANKRAVLSPVRKAGAQESVSIVRFHHPNSKIERTRRVVPDMRMQ